MTNGAYRGFTLVKLPRDIDPRGPLELGAIARARVAQAWRRRNDLPPMVRAIPRNMVRFGRAAKA